MKKQLIIALAATATLAQAQFILAVDSGRDRIVKLSTFDGSMLDDDFIVDANDANTYNFQTPKEAIVVNNQIWVSDQLSDAVYIFDINGSYVSRITGVLDNVRGIGQVGNEVWVTNDGTINGGLADRVYRYDFNGNLVGDFNTISTSPFDIITYGNNVLISDFADDTILEFDAAGNFVSTFHDSDGVSGIDNIQQIVQAGDNIFAAGFTDPSGLYRYDSSGAQTGFWQTSPNNALRGVVTLDNGLMLVSGGTRLSTINPLNGVTIDISNVAGDSWQYLTYVEAVPEPATLTILGLSALVALRKKRK